MTAEIWIALLTGIVATAGTVFVFWRRSIGERRADDRKLFAEAFGLIVEWKEMPYRIARRQDEESTTTGTIISEFHSLQRKLAELQAWVSMADEEIGTKFDALVADVRSQAEPKIKCAWNEPPQGRAQLNAKYEIDCRELEAAYLASVRKRLRRWY